MRHPRLGLRRQRVAPELNSIDLVDSAHTHRAASLHMDTGSQHAARHQPLDRHLDAIGAEIIESGIDQVIAHRRLRFRQPAAAAERLDKLLETRIPSRYPHEKVRQDGPGLTFVSEPLACPLLTKPWVGKFQGLST